MESKRVLVVDDEESMVTIIKYALEEAGYSVAAAGTPRRLGLAREFHPDLIVLDVMPARPVGLEVVRDLAPRPTPVIMLSRRARDDRILGLELARRLRYEAFSPREL